MKRERLWVKAPIRNAFINVEYKNLIIINKGKKLTICIPVTAQSLYFGDKLENTLLLPNQMGSHGIAVDNVPRHLSIDGKSSHSIYVPAEDVRLPLLLHGCISYLPTRYPTDYELENYKWLILSSDSMWDP